VDSANNTAFDGVLHMSDEVRDAPKKVPWTMVLGVAVDGICALAIMITILFCLGPLQEALDTPTGYPIIQVLYVATKSKAAATALMSLTIFSGVISLFNGLASVTRLTWVFAKDHGIPFADFFSYVGASLRCTS
jgi:choline transport protein